MSKNTFKDLRFSQLWFKKLVILNRALSQQPHSYLSVLAVVCEILFVVSRLFLLWVDYKLLNIQQMQRTGLFAEPEHRHFVLTLVNSDLTNAQMSRSVQDKLESLNNEG